MLELASLGAKVLQTRSVEFAKKYDVPVVVRSSFNDNPGTLVVKEDKDMEKVVVSGVAYDKNQAKITVMAVPDKPGVAAKLFQAIADANIVVDMIVQNISSDGKATDISFTVPKSDSKKALKITEEIAERTWSKRCQDEGRYSKDFDCRCRYEDPFRRRRQDVRDPCKHNKYHDDKHFRDKGLLHDRCEIYQSLRSGFCMMPLILQRKDNRNAGSG